MYMIISRVTYREGTTDAEINEKRKAIAAEYDKYPGLLKGQIFWSGKDEQISVTTWRSKADADEAYEPLVAWAVRHYDGLITSVERHEGEVIYNYPYV